MYFIQYNFNDGASKDDSTDFIFIKSATSFSDACNQIIAQVPTAKNFINKAI